MLWTTLWIIILLALIIGANYLYYSYVLGYRKGDLSFELDGWYTSAKEHIEATCHYLNEHGYTYRYEGDHRFFINGQHYRLHTLNVAMGAPVQRTILKKIR